MSGIFPPLPREVRWAPFVLAGIVVGFFLAIWGLQWFVYWADLLWDWLPHPP